MPMNPSSVNQTFPRSDARRDAVRGAHQPVDQPGLTASSAVIHPAVLAM